MDQVTLTDPKPIPSIPFVMTNADKDIAMLARLEIIAMKGRREPEGLEVSVATQAEWDAAVAEFRT